MSSLTIFIIGFVVLVAGLAYGAHLARIPAEWIGAGVLALVGLGVVLGVMRTRHRDPSHDSA